MLLESEPHAQPAVSGEGRGRERLSAECIGIAKVGLGDISGDRNTALKAQLKTGNGAIRWNRSRNYSMWLD